MYNFGVRVIEGFFLVSKIFSYVGNCKKYREKFGWEFECFVEIKMRLFI